jgi:hypothetical protein
MKVQYSLVVSVPDAFPTLSPSLLVDAAVHRDERGFLLLYGDALVLLVEIPQGAIDLEQGLGELDAALDPLPFRTEVQAAASSSPARAQGSEDPTKLARMFPGRVHYAFALRKRAFAEAVSDRVSVGRARNRDLVLRHPTVSKFHAWFETAEDGATYLHDADSRNQTLVNGAVLAPRARHAVGPGDVVRFGNVECVLCTPAAFWASLRVPVPKTARTERPPRAPTRPPGGR